MAVLLPGKFLYLAHPHTASTATCLALQDAFPQACDLRPHHMLLAEARGETAPQLLTVMQRREKIWDSRLHKRLAESMPPGIAARLPDGLADLHEGGELVWSVVRNPYDLWVTTYLRKDRTGNFESFVERFSHPPWVVDGRMFYHVPGSDMVLRYETLQADLDRLTARLDLNRIELGRHNETVNKQPWETYYTPRAFQIVNERFGDEFAPFYELRTE